ncbi:MAG: ATP-binding cassette, subfamily bacterial [Gaiellaceae bacterium]|nr:ATP-binding cassette, subfamily bacterial [Gaiellaceae bacterium]
MKDLARTIRFVFGAAWRVAPGRISIAVVLLVLGSLSGPLVGLALKHLFNDAVRHDVRAATLAGVLTGLLLLAAQTLGHFSHHLYFMLGHRLRLVYDEDLMELTGGATGLEQHERSDYADRLELVRQDGHSFYDTLQPLMSTGANVVSLIFISVLLVQVQPLLLLLPLFALPPLFGGKWASAKVEAARVETAEDARLARHLFSLGVDAAAGKELRVFGLQEVLRRRQHALWDGVTRRLLRAQLAGTFLNAAGQLLFALGYVGAVLLVVHDAIAGRRSPGDVVLVVALAGQVNQQVSSIVGTATQLQRLSKAVGRILWLRGLIAELEPERPPTGNVPARLERGIQLQGVAFAYPGTDTPILSDVTLEIPAGMTVAIVGENGAGKTTLVKLLCRFYEPTEGLILVDGIDLRDLDAAAWRERIAAGFQDFVKYELLMAETVGVGDVPRVTDRAAVAAALDRAHALDLVDQVPDGLEGQLGRSYWDGLELSGGQWQKLALGRAMMREQPLLVVLDEPTAALDAHAEHALFERYAASTRAAATAAGAITLFVSHRFSTVRMADLILVVRDGHVAERGSHEELLALGGTYAELFSLQASAYR